MKLPLAALLLILPLFACQATQGSNSSDLDRLNQFMTGTFSSVAQSRADEEYFAVRLVMQPIWTERTDGHWLYVEQAVETALERPYRQRIYHLTRWNGSLASEVYKLPGDALRFAGAFENPIIFADITPGDLAFLDGCTLLLNEGPEGTFAGATVGTGCASSRGGASYVTSIVEVSQNQVTSWDRGMNADGEHAWGAVSGPYIFDRKVLANVPQ